MNPTDGLLVSLQAAPGGEGSFMSSLVLMGAFVAIFYFVMLRPQQKEAKEHAALLASLEKGDRVVTAAGIHGRIHEVKSDTLVLEVAPNVHMTVERDSVRKKAVEAKPEGKP